MENNNDSSKCRKMSCGLQTDCPANIQKCMLDTNNDGYDFMVTNISHPRFTRDLISADNNPSVIGRNDKILTGLDWSRLIVGTISENIDVDSEIDHIRLRSKAQLNQELGFAGHLGLPAVIINLQRKRNTQLSQILFNKFVNGIAYYQVWVSLPMTHLSKFSLLAKHKQSSQPADSVADSDTWEFWNDLRRYCNYSKRLCVALELPPQAGYLPSDLELSRWIGEPIKALIIPTSLFLVNQHGQPVLAKRHQTIIERFMELDVQYILKGDVKGLNGNYKGYNDYMQYLGKKLYKPGALSEFSHGCEDFLQNPLQPLSEHLDTTIYEVFEKDAVKYTQYQQAITLALTNVSSDVECVVLVVVGAGRGPLVQAALNASYHTRRECRVYAVEKNPYAINTLKHRVAKDWNDKVKLVYEDMRTWKCPEPVDILVSELLGSFGDNELSPECLDGAQSCLKRDTGVSIPCSYTSFLAPIQSVKIHNEIATQRPPDKTLTAVYETPYIAHLVNYYQVSEAQPLFTFSHPNYDSNRSNERYSRLRFPPTTQSCLVTAFAGFFETTLYGDVTLSINPRSHSKDMVSWFPIIFPLAQPVQVQRNDVIEVSFWRVESSEKVWYEWCMESPVRSAICNPSGRSYFIKKHL